MGDPEAAGLREMSGEAKCCAHHGLSILLTARVGGTAHSVIFDAEAGATVVSSPDARLLAGDCFYLSGEIPRVTPYEKGLPGQVRLGADGTTWEPDPWLRDERYLAVDVKSKGIVLFSMCSHAGIVNVLTDAKARFDPRPLHGAMGGFHLSGAGVEPAIPETILGLMAFGLKKLVPAHCTGWRALNAIARSVDESVLSPSAVGRRFVF